MTSALENLFAMQLDSAGLTGYVREYQAIPGRKFRFDFAFIEPHRLLIEFGRQADPDWLTRLKKARQELHEYIAELEAESERFTVHSEIGRQDDKSPNNTQSSTIVYGKESEE